MPKFAPEVISGRPSYLCLDLPVPGQGPIPTTNGSRKGPGDVGSGVGYSSFLPALEQGCDFPEEIFVKVMLNLISNPNVNSSLLLRADVLCDSYEDENEEEEEEEEHNECRGDNCQCNGAALPQSAEKATGAEGEGPTPRALSIKNFTAYRTLVRRFVPRNPKLDRYMLQSCLFLRRGGGAGMGALGGEEEPEESLILNLPHADKASDIPFYHPTVQAIGFLHSKNPSHDPNHPTSSPFTISIHYLPFHPTTVPVTPPPTSSPPTHSTTPNPNRLSRTLHHLLSTLYKHGQGSLAGYVKRVNHDLIIPKARLQDTYLRLKSAHAKRLVNNWVESTDPRKHVFEDLLIAAFLLELWGEMYSMPKGATGFGNVRNVENMEGMGKPAFPGFVDIGCGNGVLVDILRREGCPGWGFDARRRKTWDVLLLNSSNLPNPSFDLPSTASSPPAPPQWLLESLLIPSIIPHSHSHSHSHSTHTPLPLPPSISVHNGTFPPGTFLISNHSDQLTGWTPLLAALCKGAFLAIPCCSYNLNGEKFRHALPTTIAKPRTRNGVSGGGGGNSQYAGLVSWTVSLTERLGFVPEQEVLRIPSTRNVGIIGRKFRNESNSEEEPEEREGGGVKERVLRIIAEEGGASGWVGRVVGLVKERKGGGEH